MTDRFDRGMARRREVLGDAHVDRASSAARDIDRGFQEFITEYAWGEVWSDTDLTPTMRSAVTIALLAAAGHLEELEMHMRASRPWLDDAQLRGVLMHVAIYAGVPAANTAFKIARKVTEESPEET